MKMLNGDIFLKCKTRRAKQPERAQTSSTYLEFNQVYLYRLNREISENAKGRCKSTYFGYNMESDETTAKREEVIHYRRFVLGGKSFPAVLYNYISSQLVVCFGAMGNAESDI